MTEKENRLMEESEGPVLCIEVNSGVSSKLYNDMYLPAWKKAVEKYGEIRILFYYPTPDQFPGWEEKTAKQDLAHYTEHGRELKKVALVNAPSKVTQRWDLLTPLLGGNVREFEKTDFQEALKWIKG